MSFVLYVENLKMATKSSIVLCSLRVTLGKLVGRIHEIKHMLTAE